MRAKKENICRQKFLHSLSDCFCSVALASLNRLRAEEDDGARNSAVNQSTHNDDVGSGGSHSVRSNRSVEFKTWCRKSATYRRHSSESEAD